MNVKADIEKFVAAKAQELPQNLGRDETFAEQTRKALLERTGGSFLWAGMVAAELERKRTSIQVECTVKDEANFPKGLYALYLRMLENIDPDFRDVTKRLLMWAAVAVRPLNLLEMASALGYLKPAVAETQRWIREIAIICGPYLCPC
jgi:hypothetical protein